MNSSILDVDELLRDDSFMWVWVLFQTKRMSFKRLAYWFWGGAVFGAPKGKLFIIFCVWPRLLLAWKLQESRRWNVVLCMEEQHWFHYLFLNLTTKSIANLLPCTATHLHFGLICGRGNVRRELGNGLDTFLYITNGVSWFTIVCLKNFPLPFRKWYAWTRDSFWASVPSHVR